MQHHNLVDTESASENPGPGRVAPEPALRSERRPTRGRTPGPGPGPVPHDIRSEGLHYLLGVSPGASRRELRSAYHSRMRSLAEVDQGEFRDPALRARATLLAGAYSALTRCYKSR